MNDELSRQLKDAIEADDQTALAALLAGNDSARSALDDIRFKYSMPALARARSIPAARLLIDHGASLELVSDWWSPGFWVNPHVEPAVGQFLVEQGAAVTPHAAAGLGLTDRLAAMIENDPSVVHLKGGDGNTPLAFARTIETAVLLLELGADIDARDDDHDSTPVQWLVGASPDVARYLLARGATPDIFLAAALGDHNLAARLIDDDPRCLSLWVGRDPECPAIGYRNLGGTVYQWTLGFNSFAHQYAAKRGHDDLFQFMFEKSDTKTQFLVSCLMAHRGNAERIAAASPGIIDSLDSQELQLLARYCWETNADLEAVRLMLDLGWPIDHPDNRHFYMPLHNAAFGGYADIVDLLIERGAPADVCDPTYGSTPLAAAIYYCIEDGRHPEGEYTRVVKSLIEAGSPWDASIYPTGNEKIDAGLEPFIAGR